MYEYEKTLKSVTFLQGSVVGFMVGSFCGGVLIYAALGIGRADPVPLPSPVTAATARDIPTELMAYRASLDQLRLEAAVAISQVLPFVNSVSVNTDFITWLDGKVMGTRASSATKIADAASDVDGGKPKSGSDVVPNNDQPKGEDKTEESRKEESRKEESREEEWRRLQLFLSLLVDKGKGASQSSARLNEVLQKLTKDQSVSLTKP